MFKSEDTGNSSSVARSNSGGSSSSSSDSSESQSDQIKEVDRLPTMSTQQPQHHFLVGPDPVGGNSDEKMTNDALQPAKYAYEGDLYLGLQSLSDRACLKPPSKQAGAGLKDPPPGSQAGLKKEDSSIDSSEDSDQLFIFIKRAPFRPNSLQGRSDRSSDSRRKKSGGNSTTNNSASNSPTDRPSNIATYSQSSSLSSNSGNGGSPRLSPDQDFGSGGEGYLATSYTPHSSHNAPSAMDNDSLKQRDWSSHLNDESLQQGESFGNRAAASVAGSASTPTDGAVSYDDVAEKMDWLQLDHDHRHERYEEHGRGGSSHRYDCRAPPLSNPNVDTRHELQRTASLPPLAHTGMATVDRSAYGMDRFDSRTNSGYSSYQHPATLQSNQSYGYYSQPNPAPEMPPRRAISATPPMSSFHGFTHSLLNHDAKKSRILREFRELQKCVRSDSVGDESSMILETATVELAKLAPSQPSRYHKSLIEEMNSLEQRYEWAQAEEDGRLFHAEDGRLKEELPDWSS